MNWVIWQRFSCFGHFITSKQ